MGRKITKARRTKTTRKRDWIAKGNYKNKKIIRTLDKGTLWKNVWMGTRIRKWWEHAKKDASEDQRERNSWEFEYKLRWKTLSWVLKKVSTDPEND